MTLIEAIDILEDNTELRDILLRTGLLSPTLFSYAEIHRYYTNQILELKSSGEQCYKTKAIDNTVEKFNLCKASIYLAINKFK